jgi:benzoyl-CoA reductase subunit D
VRVSEHEITAGVDVGASAVKVAIVDATASPPRVLARAAQRIRRRIVSDVVDTTFAEALAACGLEREALVYVASTGDGEAVGFRTGHFYTMTSHARGALFLVPGARAALDVGALHARAIKMDERGKVLGHRMTSQCASGSGQFVENIARYLGVPLEDVGDFSTRADAPEKVSSICAVLAETDVINMVARGITTPNILKGIHLSIAGRIARLVRAVGAEGTVALTGGLTMDSGMVAALVECLDEPTRGGRPHATLELVAHPDGMYAGAIGAGLLARIRLDQLEGRGDLSLERELLAAPVPVETEACGHGCGSKALQTLPGAAP